MKMARLNLLLAVVFAIAAIFVVGVMVHSAKAQEASATGRNGHSEASLAGGTVVRAELNSSLDSKKAKSGDSVTAHTTEAVKSADDRTSLPKGTKLVGHITQASARSKGDANSELGIGFDKAVLKGGEEVSLNVTIQALAAPAGPQGGDTMSGPNGSSNYPSSAGNNPGMPGNSGTRPTSNGTGGYPNANGTSSEAGTTSGTNSSRELAPNSHGVVGLDGLHLMMADASDNPQASVISSTGKSVHLDGGTRLLLVTQTLASSAPGQ